MRWLACVIVACMPATGLAQVTNGSTASGDPAVIAIVDAQDNIGCTASIIAPYTAITAAHCVVNRDVRLLRAFFGTTIAEGGTFVAISHARSHPGFDPGGRDVAMFTLRDAAPATPLALEPQTLDASLVGTDFRVVGFGLTGQGVDDAGIKREGTARIAAVRAEELIAVPRPSLSCLGDSGGPALLPAGTIAGVVSRTDSACSDHAVYSRVDVARAVLIDPYLAETAPGAAGVGDACFHAEHCSGGPCLQAMDDPLLYFCSRPCTRDADCPAAMACAEDGCRYPEPSPGALGSTCATAADCTSATCRDQVCTRSCTAAACPAGFACRDGYCLLRADGCGCTTSSPGTALVVVLWLLWWLRRR